MKPPPSLARLMVGAALMSACSPTFNWRDTRFEASPLVALMPCKPESASRSVPLGGREVELLLKSCDAGGASFAIAMTVLPDSRLAAQALAEWQAASLARLHAAGTAQSSFAMCGAKALADAVLVTANGQRADGRKVSARMAFFARGTQVFQAAIYAEKVDRDVSETFFCGLRLE
jgi:hypothetical protein